MTVFEFCERYGISLAKGRKIAKDNPVLRFTESSSVFDVIRTTLANGDALSVWHLVELIENPGELLNLGKYATGAERELAAVGEARFQVAPKEVVANIMEAAKGEAEAVEIMVNWLKLIIPTEPVTHAYIAVRLLLGVPASIRKTEGPRIGRALLNARNHPGLVGYWRTEKKVSRNVTLYQKLALDL